MRALRWEGGDENLGGGRCAFVGSGVGVGVGIGVGYDYCSKECDPPDNVIPFPTSQPIPLPPPPPPGGSGRDGHCFQAYTSCLLSNFNDKDHVERCRQAYLNCKKGFPTIFPGGDWVP